MSSPEIKKQDYVLTVAALESRLNARLTRTESTLRQEIVHTGVEVANSVLDAVQRMFNEQNLKNDLKFATKSEVQEFREEFQAFKEQNLSMMDQIITELKTMREEQTTGGYRQAKHSDQLANHESRIIRLEATRV